MKLMISACLIGHRVRYDGGDNLCSDKRLQELILANKVIAFCPEVAAGLPIPRSPAEIQDLQDGLSVLKDKARVLSRDGQDVTAYFVAGAQQMLDLAKKHNIKIAILKARSPSCGSTVIYDGSFSKTLIPGNGVATALLISHGIKVFDEDHIDEALDQISLKDNQ